MASMRTERKGGILKSHASEISAAIRLVDALVVFGTYWATSSVYALGAWGREELIAASIAVVVFFLAAEFNGLYRSWRGSDLRQEAFRVLSSWAAAVGALLFVAFVVKIGNSQSKMERSLVCKQGRFSSSSWPWSWPPVAERVTPMASAA